MSQHKSFREYLHLHDPYAGFDMAQAEPDLQGWGSTAGIFARLLSELRPTRIVEVGTWKGASAIHMAQLCRDEGLEAEILCIDTWLGVHGLWLRAEQTDEVLRLRNGFPTLYQTFVRNVIDAGLQDMITPLPLPSSEAAQVLTKRRIRADLIYVDGDHSYEGCKADLIAYRPVLDRGGLMLADDYAFDGVARAVGEFVAETGCEMIPVTGKCVLSFDRDVTELRAWAEEVTAKQNAFKARKAQEEADAAREASEDATVTGEARA
jgi:predicted O-methyltransferase YrrM